MASVTLQVVAMILPKCCASYWTPTAKMDLQLFLVRRWHFFMHLVLTASQASRSSTNGVNCRRGWGPLARGRKLCTFACTVSSRNKQSKATQDPSRPVHVSVLSPL